MCVLIIRKTWFSFILLEAIFMSNKLLYLTVSALQLAARIWKKKWLPCVELFLMRQWSASQSSEFSGPENTQRKARWPLCKDSWAWVPNFTEDWNQEFLGFISTSRIYIWHIFPKLFDMTCSKRCTISLLKRNLKLKLLRTQDERMPNVMSLFISSSLERKWEILTRQSFESLFILFWTNLLSVTSVNRL